MGGIFAKGAQARDLPLEYYDIPSERSLDLRPLGFDCIPRIGFSGFSSNRVGTDFHRHPGCLEICLCLRGNLYFESDGISYPFFPGRVFVSRPDQPHRMRNNPKGLRTMDMLFEIPRHGRCVLDLPGRESAWLVTSLMNLPLRLFPATKAVLTLFPRLFAIHDAKRMSPIEKRLKLKSCVLAFLLAVIDAPNAAPEARSPRLPALRSIIARMDANPMENRPIAEMAREAGLSEVAFFEEFRRATGFSPRAYVLDLRVRLAQCDLAAGMRVGEAALKFGFASPQHFSTAFKRIIGVSPRECVG